MAELKADKSRAEESASANKQQLAEAHELLRSNQQVIQWLNKELNESQMGRSRPFASMVPRAPPSHLPSSRSALPSSTLSSSSLPPTTRGGVADSLSSSVGVATTPTSTNPTSTNPTSTNPSVGSGGTPERGWTSVARGGAEGEGDDISDVGPDKSSARAATARAASKIAAAEGGMLGASDASSGTYVLTTPYAPSPQPLANPFLILSHPVPDAGTCPVPRSRHCARAPAWRSPTVRPARPRRCVRRTQRAPRAALLST